jgi:hypothetical protein
MTEETKEFDPPMIRILRPAASYRGDLILEERSKPLTARDLNLLPFAERLNLIQATRGRQKYALILDAPDPEALVPQLAVQDFYLLVREVGIEDLEEIVALATTEQLTALIDFDGWPGDQLNGPAALRWLELLLNVGDEKFLATLREIDLGLLILMLAKQFTILHAPGDIDDEDLRFEVTRGNGGYVLDYVNEEESKAVTAFLDTLYRLDAEHFYLVMEGIRWETEAQLEEDVYTARCGRLLDLGFSVPHAALAVYARIDCANFAAVAARRTPAVMYDDAPVQALRLLESASPGGLLGAVMAQGIAEDVANDLVLLINKVISADRIDPGEDKELRSATGRVYALLNLALENLCGNEVAAAAQLLAERYPEDLFRYGFSLTLALQQRARALAASPIAPLLDGPFRAGVEILRRDRPGFYEGISGIDRTGERFFASQADLEAAHNWLAGIEAQQDFFLKVAPFALPSAATFDLRGCEPDNFTDLTLSDLFLTALANRLLGNAFAPEPLSATSLPTLHQRITVEGQLDVTLRAETIRRFDAEVAGLGSFVNWCLDLWAEGFCAMAVADLDPRYVAGLIVRR